MMLWQPSSSDIGYITGNVLSTRIVASYGTAVASGSTANNFGSYVSILSGSNVAYDCFGLLLNLNGAGTVSGTKDFLVTVGVDPAGGTSFTDKITNLYAVAPTAYNTSTAGHWFYIPMLIKAGSSIGLKASSASASSPLNIYGVCWLYGQFKNSSNLKYASFSESMGAVTASSRGTTMTAGTSSEGSWTSLGTTSNNLWGWQFSIGRSGLSTITSEAGSFDFAYGNGTTFSVIADGVIYVGESGIGSSKQLKPVFYKEVPGGSTIYARCQASSSNTTAWAAIAHGFGG